MLSEKNRALIESFGRGLLPCLEASGAPVTIDEINALLNAARHQAQEEAKAVSVEGWKLVPVDPDEAMMEAGLSQWSNLRDMYGAMLAAAPNPPRDERIAALEKLLNGRDDFIVSRGLWSEFVDQPPNQHTRDRIAELERDLAAVIDAIGGPVYVPNSCFDFIRKKRVKKLQEITRDGVTFALKDKEGAE